MTISGWNTQYSKILNEFGFNKKQDSESAWLLDSIIQKPVSLLRIKKIIHRKTVFVVGAGPSLIDGVKILKKFKTVPIIVADGATQALLEHKIKPDIVVTDLDGDHKTLKKIGKTDSLMVVHAHGDNIANLHLAENFKNCLGTTQTKPVGKLQNFGGFTDGDRCVFLANHFGAKRIILIGMDFGKIVGAYSKGIFDKKIKLKKLTRGKKLLEWLSEKSNCELYTTSESIRGFKKIKPIQLKDITIT